MRRTLYFVMALALVLGFTQCKKEQVNTPENETKTVNITLKVGGNGGSRHDINTTTGAVDFQDGDVIYVGDGSTYIGTLTRTDGVFSGPINEPANGTEIYFFFVGGLTPSATPDAGTTPSFTVDISDQSTEMPVLSCNHVTYYSGTTSYSCKLENQCALVKFTTASTTDPVHVGGLYTGAKIDFANNNITNNVTTGFVNLHPDAEDNKAKWAVLLPQTGFGAEAAVAHVGYTTTIPTIAADAFITGEDAVSISTQSNIVYLDWLTSNYTATDGQTLKGRLGANVKISIAASATVTLNNATITGTNSDSYLWAGINCENNATIILEGTNNVTSFYENYPGIHIASGKTLTIQGSGTLNASSNGGVNGWGAGIGGSNRVDCGNIVINSGTINATGGIYMAGIGGGYGKNCGSITINGGNVTATGGRGAAGIGTGLTPVNITSGDISITGGTVVATGGKGAAGIGSGFEIEYGIHNTCGNISITGGQVTATGGDGGNVYPDIMNHSSWANYTYYGGAGIGTGSIPNSVEGSSSCGTITIGSGVTSVTATKGGGNRPATNSIGKNESTMNQGTCGTINIGGTVYWDGSDYQNGGDTYLPTSPLVYPAPTPVEQIVDLSTITSAYTAVDGDILTGTLGTGVQISIADGATITLRSANINGSDNLSGTFHGLNCLGDATIILENNDNVVKAKCGEDDGRAGIFVPRYKTLTIQGSGKIEANGAGEASGIGGYYGTHCGAIVINSGKVTATAGSNEYYYGYGAGIGACGLSRCDGVTINGGQTIATGYGYAAGIGTGGSDMATGFCNPGDQAAITISLSSGWVRAIKGNDATYFIGGGGSSHCGYVTIGGTTYEDGGGNRGISSSTFLSYDFTVSGNSLIYMP